MNTINDDITDDTNDDLCSYWEYELTDRDFDELMLFIQEKKADGVIVKINSSPNECDIAINHMAAFDRLKDEMRQWLKTQRAERYQEIENKYPNGRKWRF